MMQENNGVCAKKTYLHVDDAIQRVCDEELEHEMLMLLHSSIQHDWSEVEELLKTCQYTPAANILHGMKGTIPIFSDKKTEEMMQKTEALLRTSFNESDFKNTVDGLRFQMKGFISELDVWVKTQQKVVI